MKSGAFLINTSRAAIVNRQGLLDAVAGGHLGGVGLDVGLAGQQWVVEAYALFLAALLLGARCARRIEPGLKERGVNRG